MNNYNTNQGLSCQLIHFFSDNIVGILFFYFTITGFVFGIKSGSIKNLEMIPNIFANGIAGAKIFIVTALPASTFLKVLLDSKLGAWMGITISNFLLQMQMPPLILLILFIIIVGIINIIINSGSVKWLFIAPIVVPIFEKLKIAPQIVQLAYRIGDSVTNCISPTDYYLPIIISLLEMYKADSKSKVGVGTVVSLCLPYTIAYFCGLILLFIIWYILALPVGF